MNKNIMSSTEMRGLATVLFHLADRLMEASEAKLDRQVKRAKRTTKRKAKKG